MSAIKRCKGCIFWQRYNGEIANPAMRKTMNIQVPGREAHACTLRLHKTDVVDDKGEPIYRPSMNPDHAKGPRYGKRTNPNATCKHQTAKHAPYRTPGPTSDDLVQHEIDTGPIVLPSSAAQSDLTPVEVR